ncbi:MULTISPECIES: RDD family protein [Spirulina sp. CCY15215]|uniref:RDD family protein n=1 Tax=Spirulina sp. CCY15215 TaxID=2767591 RepID=UPI0019502D69|nr:RDD family protein [Spirulina major]
MRILNQVTLKTPESVELQFTLAGIGNRAYALLIDYIIWGLFLVFFLILSAIVSTQAVNIFEKFIENIDNLELWLISIQILVTFIIYVGYFVFFETLWQGQTPGKRFVKIRVICDNGKPSRLPQATLRSLLRPFDDIMFLGVFFIVLNKQEKRIGDFIAGTLVIQEERPLVAATFLVSDTAKALSAQLIQEADLSQLHPDDFTTIRNYLQRRPKMLPSAIAIKSKELAYAVKEAIALENVPEGITATQFLEAVYLAYQQEHE